MKYLLYGINYAPEPTGIGKYTAEMAEWLVARGHQVKVVTAPPYYPGWSVGAGYSAWRYRKQLMNGVTVIRCPLWIPGKPGGMQRILHLLSFAASSLPAMLTQIFWKPDIVWTCAPALICAPTAATVARIRKVAAWLHVQDFEVDIAFEMGLLKRPKIRRFARLTESALLRSFDLVSTISPRMVESLVEKSVRKERAVLFPNWVDINLIKPLGRSSQYRAKLNISVDTVVALFSGTLSKKQGIGLILDAAKLLPMTNPPILFVICGSGELKEFIRSRIAESSNVLMLDLQPKECLNEFLGMADIHLLPQDQAASDLVMPSKLTAMLSSGRPIVSSATANSQIGKIVCNCGVITPPGDPIAFATAIKNLAQDSNLRYELGANSRAYAEAHLGIDQLLHTFEATAASISAKVRNACSPK